MPILFVVESPGKIAKISKIIGNKYIVVASIGHFRDLAKKTLSIKIDDNFEPKYVITKPDVVKKLKFSMKKCNMLYIASDLDMEGEAIAQHLLDVLRPSKYKRLIFNAITKKDINHAITNAGDIDHNLVNAQKARRILDRLYGYLISPVLQKNIGPKLSAGRVQSVASKMIIDRENVITEQMKNNDDLLYSVTGKFKSEHGWDINTIMHISKKKSIIKFNSSDEIAVKKIMKKCKRSIFNLESSDSKISERNPSHPFDTCTLQQECNTSYGFTIDKTMKVAQSLYEQGYITYMRTDSVSFSKEGHKQIKEIIISKYGKKYYKYTLYENKSKHSQEAHEAIRPTKLSLECLPEKIQNKDERKVYELIWKKSVASQMISAKICIIESRISISKLSNKPIYFFMGKKEYIKSPGYLVVYGKIKDVIDKYEIDSIMNVDNILAKQEPNKLTGRFTEASFVKKLKTMGIGRPSTFANIMTTLISRNYVEKKDISGTPRKIKTFTIDSDLKLHSDELTINIGKEKNKLVPTIIGIRVNDFLEDNFQEMMDYEFTSKIENELDKISSGKKNWYDVVKSFYSNLNDNITKVKCEMNNQSNRYLGKDADGCKIYATLTKYGPVVKKINNNKEYFHKIDPDLELKNIDINQAREMLSYPKILGKYKSCDVILCNGRYGKYIEYNSKKIKIPTKITSDFSLNDAIKIIKNVGKSADKSFVLINKTRTYYTICSGKYGPYINSGGKNYKIPKKMNHTKLTKAQIISILKPIK